MAVACGATVRIVGHVPFNARRRGPGSNEEAGRGDKRLQETGTGERAQKSTDRGGAAKVDDEGFEPPASCMLGKRSTN